MPLLSNRPSPTGPILSAALPNLVWLVLAFVIVSCSLNFGPLVVGVGSAKSESRALPDFNAVEVSGSVDTTWTRGDNTSAVVEAQANLLPHIRTEVVNGTLKIDTDCSYSSMLPIRVKLVAKALSNVTLSGSGDFDASGLTGDSVEAILSGSGKINLTGDVQNLSAVLSGSGDIVAEELKTRSAHVVISGSGDASVYASGQLKAEVMGSGTVRYSGNPKDVSPQVMGSGEIVPN